MTDWQIIAVCAVVGAFATAFYVLLRELWELGELVNETFLMLQEQIYVAKAIIVEVRNAQIERWYRKPPVVKKNA